MTITTTQTTTLAFIGATFNAFSLSCGELCAQLASNLQPAVQLFARQTGGFIGHLIKQSLWFVRGITGGLYSTLPPTTRKVIVPVVAGTGLALASFVVFYTFYKKWILFSEQTPVQMGLVPVNPPTTVQAILAAGGPNAVLRHADINQDDSVRDEANNYRAELHLNNALRNAAPPDQAFQAYKEVLKTEKAIMQLATRQTRPALQVGDRIPLGLHTSFVVTQVGLFRDERPKADSSVAFSDGLTYKLRLDIDEIDHIFPAHIARFLTKIVLMWKGLPRREYFVNRETLAKARRYLLPGAHPEQILVERDLSVNSQPIELLKHGIHLGRDGAFVLRCIHTQGLTDYQTFQ